MTKQQLLEWVETEFSPIKLAVQKDVIEQSIDDAFLYLNNHSGYKYVKMYDPANVIALDKEFSMVTAVYPGTAPEWIIGSHPMWTLLGVTILDNVTSDLIAMSSAFQHYKFYIGSDFRYHWEHNEDPEVGGKVYLFNIPPNNSLVCVVGTRRFFVNEDLKAAEPLEFLKQYLKGMILIKEGMLLRKSTIMGVTTDGETMVTEGKDLMEKWEKILEEEGRWVCLATII